MLHGILSFNVYRKSIHTDQYLHFDSDQQLEHRHSYLETPGQHHILSRHSGTNKNLCNRPSQCVVTLNGCDNLQPAIRSLIDPRRITPSPVGSISLPCIQVVMKALSHTIRKAGRGTKFMHNQPTA